MAEVEIFTESGVEKDILAWLEENLDWECYLAKELGREYGREKTEVIYWNLLREQLIKLNEEIDEENVDDFLSSLRRDLSYENLLEGNREFLQILRTGKKFSIQEESGGERKYIKLIDFDDLEKNRFIAVNQATFRGKETIRPDLVLFVNGIPIVIGELKSVAQEKDYYDAIDDMKDYEKSVPRLFVPALLNLAVDGLEYRYGPTDGTHKDYRPWREAPPEHEDMKNEVKRAVHSMLNKETLLDILRYFVFYGQREGRTTKIIPRDMQYYATNRILRRISRGKHKRGLVWHTQGSGKSYTMFFTANKIQKTRLVENPKVLIIVDRDNLNEQMKKDLYNVGFPNFVVARTIRHLENLLKEDASRTILTTIQKFQDVNARVEDDNFVILSDEAHRFLEKKMGSMLKATLPNAYHFGFTGTPVKERDRDTFKHFMSSGENKPLHRYSIAKGIRDDLILPVHFEIMDPVWELNEDELRELDLDYDREFGDLSIEERAKAIREHVNRTDLSELRPRVETIVEKIHEHFAEKFQDTEYKGMIVTPSRRAAAIYKEEMDKIRNPAETEVIYSGGSSSNDVITQYFKSTDEIDRIIEDFEDPGKNPRILIVCDMLLTGFDAPILKVMYLDRPLHDHTLLQAIARTNRPRDGKYNGLIVDFQRVFENIDDALDYDEEVKKVAAIPDDELKKDFEKTLDHALNLFEKVDFQDTQEAVDLCVRLLSKNPERRRKFKEGYRKLQDLYDTISPNEFLVRDGIDSKYQLVSQIHIAYMRQRRREKSPEKRLRKRTRELIEKHVDISGIEDRYPIYELDADHLEKIRGLEPDAKAAEIAYATQKHIKASLGRNPRYNRLSDRVRDIVESWQGGEIEDQVAVRKLSGMEREVLELKTRPDDLGMTHGEFAIYTLLQDEYGEAVESGGEREQIAREIGEAFDQIDTGFTGWDTNEEVRKKLRKGVIDVIIGHEKVDSLYKEGDFVGKAVEYIVENERRGE